MPGNVGTPPGPTAPSPRQSLVRGGPEPPLLLPCQGPSHSSQRRHCTQALLEAAGGEAPPWAPGGGGQTPLLPCQPPPQGWEVRGAPGSGRPGCRGAGRYAASQAPEAWLSEVAPRWGLRTCRPRILSGARRVSRVLTGAQVARKALIRSGRGSRLPGSETCPVVGSPWRLEEGPGTGGCGGLCLRAVPGPGHWGPQMAASASCVCPGWLGFQGGSHHEVWSLSWQTRRAGEGPGATGHQHPSGRTRGRPVAPRSASISREAPPLQQGKPRKGPPPPPREAQWGAVCWGWGSFDNLAAAAAVQEDRKSVVLGKECRSRWSPYH